MERPTVPLDEKEALARVLCAASIMMVVAVTAMFSRGWVPTQVAYPTWALCSTALLAIGAVQSTPRSTPTMLGATVALLAAGYILFSEVLAHQDTWVFMAFAIGMPSIGVWGFLVDQAARLTSRKAVRMCWKAAGMAYLVAVIAGPVALVFLLARPE